MFVLPLLEILVFWGLLSALLCPEVLSLAECDLLGPFQHCRGHSQLYTGGLITSRFQSIFSPSHCLFFFFSCTCSFYKVTAAKFVYQDAYMFCSKEH